MRNRDKIIHTVETKGLLDHAIRKGRSIPARAVIATSNIVGMSIAWPQVFAAAKLTGIRSASRVLARAHALRVRRILWSSIASALVPVETPSRGPRLTEITGTPPDQFLLQVREIS
jgi:hypothetical protein